MKNFFYELLENDHITRFNNSIEAANIRYPQWNDLTKSQQENFREFNRLKLRVAKIDIIIIKL